MKSFERPISQWKELESELRIPLGAIEVYRTRFGEIENRLAGAVRRLGHLELGSPFDTILPGENRHATPAPLAEALDVSMRHALGHSISGHRDVRRRITSEYDDMVLSSELLKDLHRSVLDTKAPGAGVFRTNPSHFPEFDADGNWIASTLTVPPGDVTIYLEHLHERFHGLMESNVVHPMLPIAGYAFDLF
ncbi:MAG: hypothetical protein PVG63_07420, partial [Anaerolineales bacterium]